MGLRAAHLELERQQKLAQEQEPYHSLYDEPHEPQPVQVVQDPVTGEPLFASSRFWFAVVGVAFMIMQYLRGDIDPTAAQVGVGALIAAYLGVKTLKP